MRETMMRYPLQATERDMLVLQRKYKMEKIE